MNPDGLRNQIEGNIVQTLSRALHDEVTFDTFGIKNGKLVEHGDAAVINPPMPSGAGRGGQR